MANIPEVKLGIIAVSRDCFIISMSEKRRKAVVEAFNAKSKNLYEAKTTVENEKDMVKALEEVNTAGCNALCVFLGNFGPETPETQIAQYFDGPVMYVAAAEETGKDLINGRGDAYCGMLNCSYNLGLRNIPAVIPEYPVGTATEVADMMLDFIPVARTLIGLSSLKVISFGPRPQDFFACNAPIKPLYDIGVEVQENSELDLLVSYKEHKDDKRIPAVVEDMAKELGAKGNTYPDILPRMAQFELTLLDWAENNKGSRDYVVFADKCWPAFPSEFGFEPCYVNSRLCSRGIPVACEVDIYGAVSEYIGYCVTDNPVTILDINNSVPQDLYNEDIKGKFNYTLKDTFMGFHCGNTPKSCMGNCSIKFQLIQNRLLEDGGKPDITRGTLEGDIKPGEITFYRLQSTADGELKAYIAEGEVLPVPTRSFGSIGLFAIPEMGRFYRHVLIEKQYPHHGAVAFAHSGKALYTIFRYLGIEDIAFNQPKGMMYPSENPFC
jgi:L-fucose isomerase-like protein